MKKNIIKSILKKIKQYNTIVIARHIGPDPDAVSSQIALRDVILNAYPHKKVYAVGSPVAKFKYLGTLDKFTDDMYENSLLIVVDVPDKGRVDGVNPDLFKESIKIDHHPFLEEFCTIEWIDDTASSAAQMVADLIFKSHFKITEEIASKLFIGIVSDTNRFLFDYTSSQTFEIITKLIKEIKFDFTSLYENLYIRPLKEVKFQGYIINNLTVTENGLGYLFLTKEVLREHDLDAPTACNLINEFNYIKEILVWTILVEDEANNNIRGSIRSRGPIINEIASKYNGGGHIFASGVRPNDEKMAKELINDLEHICKEY